MRTSFNAFCFYLSDKFMSFTFFKAYSLLSVILRTLYTDEYAPSPVFAFVGRAKEIVKRDAGKKAIITLEPGATLDLTAIKKR